MAQPSNNTVPTNLVNNNNNNKPQPQYRNDGQDPSRSGRPNNNNQSFNSNRQQGYQGGGRPQQQQRPEYMPRTTFPTSPPVFAPSFHPTHVTLLMTHEDLVRQRLTFICQELQKKYASTSFSNEIDEVCVKILDSNNEFMRLHNLPTPTPMNGPVLNSSKPPVVPTFTASSRNTAPLVCTPQPKKADTDSDADSSTTVNITVKKSDDNSSSTNTDQESSASSSSSSSSSAPPPPKKSPKKGKAKSSTNNKPTKTKNNKKK